MCPRAMLVLLAIWPLVCGCNGRPKGLAQVLGAVKGNVVLRQDGFVRVASSFSLQDEHLQMLDKSCKDECKLAGADRYCASVPDVCLVYSHQPVYSHQQRSAHSGKASKQAGRHYLACFQKLGCMVADAAAD